MPRINDFQKGQIVALFAEGLSKVAIGRRLGIDESVVRYNLRKLEETGTMAQRPVTGRPRVTTERDDRHLIMAAKNSRFKSASDLKLEVLGPTAAVSASTVKRRLNKAGFHGRVACKKPYLTPRHKEQRLHFALLYRDWTREEWSHVLFSDESKFNLRCSDAGIRRVWRKKGERYLPECIVPTFKFGGGGSIMVWGCFSRNGVGVLHRIHGIMNQHVYKQVLLDAMTPSVRNLFGDEEFIFQHDNDPKHTASTMQDWLYEPEGLQDHPIHVLVWPPQSPDLNPIENLWGELDRARHGRLARDIEELWDHVNEAWQSISLDYLHNLVDSMPERCRAVIEAQGGSTKY